MSIHISALGDQRLRTGNGNPKNLLSGCFSRFLSILFVLLRRIGEKSAYDHSGFVPLSRRCSFPKRWKLFRIGRPTKLSAWLLVIDQAEQQRSTESAPLFYGGSLSGSSENFPVESDEDGKCEISFPQIFLYITFLVLLINASL